jgi:anti-anti-sigma factor
MNVKFERKHGILVVAPEGRMDAFAAVNLDKELEILLKEDDSYLVLDMASVPYLSSGGIRVILAAQKKLARKDGRVYLCSLLEYPVQVIKMAGMDIIFNNYGTVDEAINKILLLENIKQSEKDILHLPCYNKHHTCFHVFHATDNIAKLKIVGNLMKVMHATLEAGDIRERHFSETEYSIGLGALGGTMEDCLPLLGEMITIGGTMVWLPTDGNDTPDFLIPQKDTREVIIRTGLNLALEGEFNDIVLVGDVDKSLPITISELYEAILDINRERHGPHSGLVSIAMVADLHSLFSSGVKVSPVKSFTPVNGGLITDPENIVQWMDINTEAKYPGNTMVSFGLGLDLTADLSGLSKTALDNVFYLHPANVGSKKMLLHNHGVVFESLEWQHALDLDSAIRKIVHQGKFVDMRHLLDTTRITRAIVGVSHISNIRVE